MVTGTAVVREVVTVVLMLHAVVVLRLLVVLRVYVVLRETVVFRLLASVRDVCLVVLPPAEVYQYVVM